MRILRMMAVVGCLVAALGNRAEADGNIPWLTDWRQARDIAQQQHRLILLHFWSETCGPCVQLERNVFNRPEVARALATAYIPVKINVDRDPEFTKHYGVKSWPTDIIVDGTGRVLHRQVSSQDPRQYVALLDNVKSHSSVAMLASMQPQPQYLSSPTAAPNPGSNLPANTARGFLGAASQTTNQYNAAPPANPFAKTTPSQQAPQAGPYANPYHSNQGPALTAGSTPNNAISPQTQSGSIYSGNSSWQQSAPTVTQQPASQANPTANAFAVGNAQSSGMVFNQYSSSAPTSNPAVISSPTTNPWSDHGSRQAMATQAARPPLPAQAAGVGLESYCPVTLVERNTWSRGNTRWGANHMGRVYLFSSAENQQRFLTNPDAYAPILRGYDPVRYMDQGTVVDGKRKHGLYYGEKYFLFSDESTLQQFQGNPNRYLSANTVR